MRILVAEDERDLNRLICRTLERAGYSVDTCFDGEAALDCLLGAEYDCLLLDIMMPKKDGHEVLRVVRAQGSSTPVIFLTARDSVQDRIEGLDLGADDYLVKPFYNMELILRVRAHLRRAKDYGPASVPEVAEREERPGIIHYKDLRLDLDRQSVEMDGEVIVLTYTEFKILELFLTHRKKIFSMDNIYQSVWEDEAVGDGTIMVHIKNLRKKLKDNSRNPEYIKTAWGKGYYVD